AVGRSDPGRGGDTRQRAARSPRSAANSLDAAWRPSASTRISCTRLATRVAADESAPSPARYSEVSESVASPSRLTRSVRAAELFAASSALEVELLAVAASTCASSIAVAQQASTS